MKTVLVFAGTSEGRMLVERLVGMHVRCVACVATEYGSALLPAYESVAVLQGRMVAAQMRDVILRENTQLVIDATHPTPSKQAEISGRPALRRASSCGGWCVSAPIWR